MKIQTLFAVYDISRYVELIRSVSKAVQRE